MATSTTPIQACRELVDDPGACAPHLQPLQGLCHTRGHTLGAEVKGVLPVPPHLQYRQYQ